MKTSKFDTTKTTGLKCIIRTIQHCGTGPLSVASLITLQNQIKSDNYKMVHMQDWITLILFNVARKLLFKYIYMVVTSGAILYPSS